MSSNPLNPPYYKGGVIVLLVVLALFFWRDYKDTRFVFIPNDIQVTIPEGTNVADIERIILFSGIVLTDSLLKDGLMLEGYLFPDTYRFEKTSSASDIISRMKKEYPDRRQLIIASILEKEVQTESDMRIVAGIIEKRLQAGMALQLDATVAYGACLSKMLVGTYCDVSEVNIVDNIKRDSAYNTYTRAGLPQGPISNPGVVALRAAANPGESPYWYYLSAKDGTTIFSRTLEEHNRARAQYLR